MTQIEKMKYLNNPIAFNLPLQYIRNINNRLQEIYNKQPEIKTIDTFNQIELKKVIDEGKNINDVVIELKEDLKDWIPLYTNPSLKIDTKVNQELTSTQENEPVAWMYQDNVTDEWEFSSLKVAGNCEPLYTTPQTKDFKYDPETGEPLIDGYPLYSGLPKRKLSDEEIIKLFWDASWGTDEDVIKFARAIELKIRGDS